MLYVPIEWGKQILNSRLCCVVVIASLCHRPILRAVIRFICTLSYFLTTIYISCKILIIYIDNKLAGRWVVNYDENHVYKNNDKQGAARQGTPSYCVRAKGKYTYLKCFQSRSP